MKSTNEKNSPMERSLLMELFEIELKDIYWAEHAMSKALPKMAKKSSSPELEDVLQSHLEETQGHVEKLEHIFDLIGKKAVGKKCMAMAGLLEEAEGLIEETKEGAQRDAAIISAAQKVEHYEIATYGTLSSFALTLGLMEAVHLLEEILDEEKNADVRLTEVAVSTINLEAFQEEEAEEEE